MNTEKAAKILNLRALLAAQFGSAPVRTGSFLETGWPGLDDALQGGLRKGGMVEMVGEGKTSGSATLLRTLLLHAAEEARWVALIDGADCFDPQALGVASFARLLWVRCRTATQAMQCADLLLRDGNLPLVFLDLHQNRAEELRRVPSHAWYRLQRMLEPTATSLLACTPHPLIPCAEARLLLQGNFTLAALQQEPGELQREYRFSVLRQRAVQGSTRELAAEPLQATA